MSIRTAERSLGEPIRSLAEGLQLCPPHDWRCPVTMKLDPDHLAWTCSRCGAIITTGLCADRPD